MRLSKQHIGRLFDVQGADGSWVYQLVAVKKGNLLFYLINESKFETDTNQHVDWRPFTTYPLSKDKIKYGWSVAKGPR